MCLLTLAQFWASRVKLLIKYRQYIIVNVANEWSPNGNNLLYREAYKSVITTIRNAGYSGLLMADTAESLWPPIMYGKDLLSYDPSHNLVFSLHCYSKW